MSFVTSTSILIHWLCHFLLVEVFAKSCARCNLHINKNRHFYRIIWINNLWHRFWQRQKETFIIRENSENNLTMSKAIKWSENKNYENGTPTHKRGSFFFICFLGKSLQKSDKKRILIFMSHLFAVTIILLFRNKNKSHKTNVMPIFLYRLHFPMKPFTTH